MTSRGSGGVPQETYRSAGVDLEAAEEAVDRIRSLVASTARPERRVPRERRPSTPSFVFPSSTATEPT